METTLLETSLCSSSFSKTVYPQPLNRDQNLIPFGTTLLRLPWNVLCNSFITEHSLCPQQLSIPSLSMTDCFATYSTQKGHFGEFFPANLLASTQETKPNTIKANNSRTK